MSDFLHRAITAVAMMLSNPKPTPQTAKALADLVDEAVQLAPEGPLTEAWQVVHAVVNEATKPDKPKKKTKQPCGETVAAWTQLTSLLQRPLNAAEKKRVRDFIEAALSKDGTASAFPDPDQQLVRLKRAIEAVRDGKLDLGKAQFAVSNIIAASPGFARRITQQIKEWKDE